MNTDRPVAFDETTARRLVALLGQQRSDLTPLRQEVPPQVPTARRHRWAKATTNYLYPSYPTEGNVVLVEFGEYQFTRPSGVNQTVSQTWVPYTTNPYDESGFALAIVPTGGTLPTEGQVVRVDLDDGQWYIRPSGSATSTPFLFCDSFSRQLASGSGSPGTDQISAARYGTIFFGDVYGDQSAACVTVLSGAAVDDPCFRIEQDGFYEMWLWVSGYDVTSYTATDYRYDITLGGTSYRAIDTWHHSRLTAAAYYRAGSVGYYTNRFCQGQSDRIIYGGYCNAAGSAVSSLTGGLWQAGRDEIAQSWSAGNLSAGDEFTVWTTYVGFSAIADTARKFEIDHAQILIVRHGDQITPT